MPWIGGGGKATIMPPGMPNSFGRTRLTISVAVWPGGRSSQGLRIANSTAESVAALIKDDGELLALARRARERTLDCHTALQRAHRLIDLLERPRDESDAAQDQISVAGGRS